MRFFFPVIVLVVLFGCDEARVYEKNVDFDNRYWPVGERPEFEFEIADTVPAYNLYCNLRNSIAYPYARIFVTYYLADSTHAVMDKQMVSGLLFDEKTGKPHGTSGLGDLYDHRMPLLRDHRFRYRGKYSVRFEQFMRTDTLAGILAVGLRVEKATSSD